MDPQNQDQTRPLPPLTKQEREMVLYTWNDTQVDYLRDSLLHDLIMAQAQQNPQRIALTFEGENLTYAELDRRSNQLAHHLHALGVGVESLVGLCIHRSLEMVIGVLGIIKAGGAFIPIDPAFPPARIKLMLEDAQPAVLVTGEELLADLESEAYTAVCLDRDWPLIASRPAEALPVAMNSENLAYVIYTSGSTGTPKGVKIVHRALINQLDAKESYLRIQAHDHVLATTTISFDPAIWEIFLPLTRGAHLTIAPREAMLDGARLQRMIEEGGVTIMRGTPTNWRILLASGWQGKADLKAVCGGESLTLDLAHQIRKRAAFLSNGYGPTEITIAATVSIITPETELITIGRPHINTQIYILDENLEPVPIGAIGEIYIAGEGVSPGYLNRPKLTAERFIPNPFAAGRSGVGPVMYKSGDLASYLTDGRILFRGRNDSQVKIRGNRVEMGDIEAAVRRHPAVSNNVTLAREDTPGDLRLVSYLILEPGHKPPDARELREFLRQTLPEYMLPARFVLLNKFPVTPNGKIDRRALPAPDPWGKELSSRTIQPRTDLEKEVAGLFGEVLNLMRVSIVDSFFDLGGNSLLAAHLLLKVQEHFLLQISLRNFLAQPTVAGLCQVIGAWPQRGSAQQLTEENVPQKVEGIEEEILAQSNLTRGQFLIWMGQQIHPDAPLYNVVSAFDIKGQLDEVAFRHAFQALVDFSDALRTVIVDVNGVPQQEFRENITAPVKVLDFSLQPDPQSALQEWLEQRKKRPFHLHHQLYDAVLLKLAGDRFVWYLCQHHIITDAVSAELLFKRLANYYQLTLNDLLSDIPDPPQFADFVRSERELRRSERYRQAAAYWRDKYQTPLPPTDFYGKSAVNSSLRTERLLCRLGVERSNRLRELAGLDSFASPSEDMSLFTIFATLLFTTLYRINGRRTLRLGTPFHGRPTAASQKIAGLFVEMGALQIEVEDGETFVSLGKKVMDEILDGLAHIQPGISSAATNRAFDVTLNLIQASYLTFAGLPVTKIPVQIGSMDAGDSLRLFVTDYGRSGSFDIAFDSKSDLLDEVQRQWLVDHFLRVVDAFIASHRQSLDTFTLLKPAQRRQLLFDFNSNARLFPSDLHLHQLVERQAAAAPNAIAVIAPDGEQLTYDQLDRRANQLAHHLHHLGVVPDMPVGVFLERSLEMVIALLGILKAGGAYVPIDPNYPPERIRLMLEDADISILLSRESESISLPPWAGHLLTLDRDWPLVAVESDAPLHNTAVAENLAYVIFTSGSTGKPKGVMISHRAICNHMLWMQAELPLTPTDRVLQKTPFSFDASIWEFWAPLAAGAALVLAPPLAHADSRLLVDSIKQHSITILQLVPTQLNLILAEESKRFAGCTSLRRIFCGGEALQADLVNQCHALLDAEVTNLYGPTEAAIDTTYYHCRRGAVPPLVPIGRPVANAQLYVLDKELQPVPIGIPGELHIGGTGLAHGYLNRPELTAERFIANPFATETAVPARKQENQTMYKTGDRVRYQPDGNLQFLGRLDQQVKIRGYRIELGGIDAALSRHSGVSNSITLAREDTSGNLQMVSYLIPQQGEERPMDRELRAYLRQTLPLYMLPARFVILDRFPLLASGKIDHGRLPDPPAETSQPDVDTMPPRSPLEQQLATIWSQSLYDRQPGVTDNFFDLGGASIPAVQVVAQVNRQYGITFPLSTFFAHPTIAEQGRILEELLVAQLEEMSDEEAARLLGAMDE